VEVLSADLTKRHGNGQVVFIGLQASVDGKLPALRLANPERKLRCEIPVQLRFSLARKN
jgi:hypothetical protein